MNIDGYDATKKVIQLFNKFDNRTQIKAVLIDGISLAGFNIVDIYKVSKSIDKPIISITSNEPNPERFQRTMDKTGNKDQKFENFGPHKEIELNDGTTFVQFTGTGFEKVKQIINLSIISGLTPEPIRVAHMIGQGLKDV